MEVTNEIVVGWGMLALLIAGIAQGKNLSGFGWFLGGLVFGPIALLFLLFLNKQKRSKWNWL